MILQAEKTLKIVKTWLKYIFYVHELRSILLQIPLSLVSSP